MAGSWNNILAFVANFVLVYSNGMVYHYTYPFAPQQQQRYKCAESSLIQC